MTPGPTEPTEADQLRSSAAAAGGVGDKGGEAGGEAGPEGLSPTRRPPSKLKAAITATMMASSPLRTGRSVAGTWA